MSNIGNRDAVITVAVIVAITVGLAYGTPFSGNVRVTIAFVGVAIAFFVADRLKMRQYRANLHHERGDGGRQYAGAED